MTADTQNPGGWPDAERPGVPTNPERDGWHWVQAHKKLDAFMFRNPWRWRAASQTWSLADDTETPAEEARVCHYLGPCLLPSEVAARVAAARREGIEAAWGVVADEPVTEGKLTFHEVMQRDERMMERIRALLEDGR